MRLYVVYDFSAALFVLTAITHSSPQDLSTVHYRYRNKNENEDENEINKMEGIN